MSIYNILLNSSNVISPNNTTFRYDFINGNFDIEEGAQMCISQINIPYSWFNINKSYYNNSNFSFYFGGITLYNITFPDGFYLTSDINNYIQQYCIANNLYKIDTTTGQNVYFIYLFSNVTYYANQFLLYPIDDIPYAGFTYPVGFPYSGANYIPKVLFSNSSNFGSILGFTSGLYPSSNQSTALSLLSNTTPNATPINNVVVRSNVISNDCASPSDILDTFPININYGSLINYNPSYEKWISAKSGSYQNLYISFVDQNLNTIFSRDPNVSISILLKQGIKKPLIMPLNDLSTIKKNEIKTIEFNEE
jgi:hypothetical protein